MLANSKEKQDLVKHLVGTMLMAMHCAKVIGINDQELINIIGLSAFLHDIGKCTKYFQNITLTDAGSLPEAEYKKAVLEQYPNANIDEVKYYARHNEIACVYAIFHAKAKNNQFKNIGTQAIFWHHGTYLNLNTRTIQNVINEMNSFDNNEYRLVFAQISDIIKSAKAQFPFDISNYIEDDVDESQTKIPLLFGEDIGEDDILNAKRLVCRSCLIHADHIVSKLSISSLDDLIANGAEKYFPANKLVEYAEFKCPKGYDIKRFDQQREIVMQSARTTLVKAPAGYGKLLIGLMWGANLKSKIYWVCPRNAVAEGVYDGLLREVDKFGLSIRIGLYLSSEMKETNIPGANPETVSIDDIDIFVTNIDNLLSPMVAYKAANRLFDVSARCVVLDEFHEFVNDEALFAAFIVYMKARHLLCANSNTILLSATPSVLNKLWDSGSKKTLILPNEESHYSAQHQVPYTFSFEDDFVESPSTGSLTVYSSIRNVQHYYGNEYTQIVHSNYSDEDRKGKIANIFAAFGKGHNKNETVISGPILQAALDISFSELFKGSESPESDIQTLGRVNRWGEITTPCNVHVLNLRHDIRERSSIVTRYKLALSKKWEEFIKLRVVGDVTLDDLYRIYNEFNQVHEAELIAFLRSQYVESTTKLCKFFPRQYKERKDKKSKKVVSSKNLRNIGDSYFVVVRYKRSGKWCPFTFSVRDMDMKDLIGKDRKKIESSKLKTIWEKLNQITDNKGDVVYDFDEMIHKFFGKKSKPATVEKLLSYAKCSETPLPIFSWTYDKTLGLDKG